MQAALKKRCNQLQLPDEARKLFGQHIPARGLYVKHACKGRATVFEATACFKTARSGAMETGNGQEKTNPQSLVPPQPRKPTNTFEVQQDASFMTVDCI